jgi:hypothetical protein
MAKQFEWARLDGRSSVHEGYRKLAQCIGCHFDSPHRIRWAVWYVDNIGAPVGERCIGVGILRSGFVGGVAVSPTREYDRLYIRWLIPD